MIVELARGLANQAILAGCDDTEKYQKRVHKDIQKEGGYRIQMSPSDIAVLVNHARHALKGKRMLCLGVETFGAERFIAEQLGMLAVDVVYSKESKDSSGNAVSLIRDGIKVDGSGKPHGTYDLITLFGDNEFNLRRIIHEHAKVDTLIACLNISIKSGMPDLRNAWFELRRLHYALLQNIDPADMGVGMVRITHKEELNAVQIESTKRIPLCQPSRSGEGVSSAHTEGGQVARTQKDSIQTKTAGHRENGEDERVRDNDQTQNNREQPPAPEGNQGGQRERGEESRDSGQREIREAEAVSGTLEASPVQERPQEEVKVFNIQMVEGEGHISPQLEAKLAPWGRKKDGTPRSRPGRPVVA